MCRYGFKNYKLTYSCFKCQVGFKRRNLSDVQPNVFDDINFKARKELGSGVYLGSATDFKCPNCGGEMANLGRDLRLPSKNKDEQWRAIKYLVDNKYNIYSCGCNGIGFVPHKLSEAMELVTEDKKQQALSLQYAKNIDKLEQKQKEKNTREIERVTKAKMREIKKEDKVNVIV